MKNLFLFSISLICFFLNICCENQRAGSLISQDSYVQFTSDPPGATVEIGVDINGDNFMPGTGRQIGATPTKAALGEGDINDDGKVNFIMLRGALTTIGQVVVDRPPVPGKTYNYHQKY